jgi:quercetin dioxygenase-like cupin family protein
VLRLPTGAVLDLERTDADGFPRLVFVVEGHARVRLSEVDHDLNEGSTLSLRSEDHARISATTDCVLLRVMIDASRDVDHWRPIA